MKIGLTYTISPKIKDVSKHNNYLEWLNLSPQDEIIIFKLSDQNSKRIEECDGLIMSGGVDIHPEFYNSSNLKYCNAPLEFQHDRDKFEIDLLDKAFERSIPILAICRGFQLVNCFLKGTLIQDLGDSLNKIHKGVNKDFDRAHGINIVANSFLSEISAQERAVINSAHHQAIDRLGEGLMFNCRADDDTIEGIEWADKKDKPFFLGVQWHPERMNKFQLDNYPNTKNIRDKFILAVTEQASKTIEST